MKKLKRIEIEVHPLDNTGYLVQATAHIENTEQKENNVPEGASLMSMFSMGGGGNCEHVIKKFYAPDSHKVGEFIQEIINSANITAGIKGGQ